MPIVHRGDGVAAVTPHHLATEAAVSVMAAGGNAADGIIAANAVLGMVLPDTCGIGGDLFAIVHRPGMGPPEVLNSSGRGGSGLDADALRSQGHRRMPPRHAASVTVPGCVDGWAALSRRHGALSLRRVLQPAIELGFEGFPVALELAHALAHSGEFLAGDTGAASLYPDGAPPAPGDVIARPDLANTLQAVAHDGREAFYTGDVAAAITTATGGVLTEADLATDAPDWVEPAGLDIFGLHAWTTPPNSQGYLTLAALWLVERIGPPADPGDPAFHHAVLEAYRAMAWERDDLVADPEHAPLGAGALLDPDRLAERLSGFAPDSAGAWGRPAPAPGGTAYLCAVDGDGMGVSLIQSNFMGIGSLISVPGAGFLLHNRGAGFSLEPGHVNEAAPGKRPLHTLAPTLWTDDDGLRLLLGTRGGHQQPQYLAQVAAAMLLTALDPGAAQETPRWHVEDAGAAGESVVSVEAGMPEDVVAGLRAAGHAVTIEPDRPAGWGPVSIISVAADGARTAAADPRVSTAAAGGD